MFNDIVDFLARNVVGFFILNLLLRFYLQLARAPFAHPLAQFSVKVTDFAVLPLRRVVPGIAGYDIATVLLAWLAALLMDTVLLLAWPINWANVAVWSGFAMLALVEVLRFSLYLLFVAVLVQAILSWIHPDNPLSPILNLLTRPLLMPLRRLLPSIANIDISPLLLLFIIELLQRFVLESTHAGVMAYILSAR